MYVAKVFWFGQSQAVCLPDNLRFDADEVRVRYQGNIVILEPVPRDWKWLDSVVGEIDDDFESAVYEQPTVL